MKCSICDTEIEEYEEGVIGYFGVIDVAFCCWCYAGIIDMVDKVRCRNCPLKKRELKKKRRKR